jgi:hypothetical protein
MSAITFSLPSFLPANEILNKLRVTMSDVASRALMAILTAFCLTTICWIGWAWATPGDFFANGSPWLAPSEIAAGVVGLVVGWAAQGRWCLLIIVRSAASLYYWVFVPTGWWSHPPHP